jgi:hypothetical protein
MSASTTEQIIDLFWQNSVSILLTQLVVKLLAHFRNERLREDSEIFLKISLCVIFDIEKSEFTKEDFIYLVQNFGPFDNGFLQRIFNLVEKPYFFGKMDSYDAEDLLKNSDLNSVLIRMSNTNNCFTASFPHPRDPHDIIHQRYKRDPTNGKINMNRLNGHIDVYDTFDQLVLGLKYPFAEKKISIMVHFYKEVANDNKYSLHHEKRNAMQALALIKLGELYIKMENYPKAMKYFIRNDIMFNDISEGRNCLKMLYKDNPTFQLFEKSIRKNIILKERIKYMPGGIGAIEAQDHFKLINTHCDNSDNKYVFKNMMLVPTNTVDCDLL